MRQRITLLLTLFLLTLSQLTAQAEGPLVRFLFFYSEDCPHCQAVIQEVLTPLQEKYGTQLEMRSIEISTAENYEWLLDMEAAYRIPADQVSIPEVFIGDTALIGEAEIRARLDETIARYLAAGGVDYPLRPSSTPSLEPTIKACKHCGDGEEPPLVIMPQPQVAFYYFYDRKCGKCLVVTEEIITPLKAQYGEQLLVEERDVESSITNYSLMCTLEQQYGLAVGGMPEVFIGEHALAGDKEIADRLPKLISMYMAQGGVALPEVQATPPPTMGDAPLIHLAYFYQVGCRECDRAELDLHYLQQHYPLAISEFDVREHSALCEWLGAQAGIPEEKRLTAPAVFVGNKALVGEEINARSLEALVEKYATTGAPPLWEKFNPAEAEQSIVERFKSLGVLTVAFAGLIDGLNPCAFATLIFFVSYLTISGRKGKEVLAVGTAFTMGVFLAYLAVGLGFHRVLGLFADLLTILGRWLYGLTAALCAVLAIVSFLDFRKARRGEIGDMTLNLPHGLRLRINAIIRRGRRSRTFVAGAFVTGILVSFLELACTGQVYLPTIIFVMSVPEMRARAASFLLLYNLLFITPLLVVFALVWYGTGAKQLSSFLQRHAATIKLGMALLFAGLATWLIIVLL